jgi:hypothetical protein
MLKKNLKITYDATLDFFSKSNINPKPAKSKTDAINPNPIKNSI